MGGGYFTMKKDAITDNSLPRIRVGNISTPIITSSYHHIITAAITGRREKGYMFEWVD